MGSTPLGGPSGSRSVYEGVYDCVCILIDRTHALPVFPHRTRNHVSLSIQPNQHVTRIKKPTIETSFVTAKLDAPCLQFGSIDGWSPVVLPLQAVQKRAVPQLAHCQSFFPFAKVNANRGAECSLSQAGSATFVLVCHFQK